MYSIYKNNLFRSNFTENGMKQKRGKQFKARKKTNWVCW